MRTYLLSLPHVLEAEQFGGLIYWVGDKAIGGKMFAMLNPEASHGHPISYPAGAERYHALLEQDGFVPAAYLARVFWVSVERWDALRNIEWESELQAAHAITFAKLPPKARRILALPRAEQKRAVAQARVLAADKAKLKTGAP